MTIGNNEDLCLSLSFDTKICEGCSENSSGIVSPSNAQITAQMSVNKRGPPQLLQGRVTCHVFLTELPGSDVSSSEASPSELMERFEAGTSLVLLFSEVIWP